VCIVSRGAGACVGQRAVYGIVGSRTPLDVVLVEPRLVAEIDVDTAQNRGVGRHPARLVRLREDMAPADVAESGQGAVPAAG
jgi:hypothetical protein